nr:hypothetical protein [Frankia canadensis]
MQVDGTPVGITKDVVTWGKNSSEAGVGDGQAYPGPPGRWAGTRRVELEDGTPGQDRGIVLRTGSMAFTLERQTEIPVEIMG